MNLIVQCIGAALLLVAYFGFQARFWTDVQWQFLVLNIVGAGMLATTAWIEGQYGFAVLNTIWCLVGVRSFVSLMGRVG